MSIQGHSNLHSHAGSGRRFGRLVSGLVLLTSTAVFAADDYQQRMLFTPSESTFKAEAKGRIMIYDGLDRRTADRAMDERYDRIDHMMFVRTGEQQDDGESFEEDDDC